MQQSLLKSNMWTSHTHELYICIYVYREHIDMDTYTDTYMHENTFYRKASKK